MPGTRRLARLTVALAFGICIACAASLRQPTAQDVVSYLEWCRTQR